MSVSDVLAFILVVFTIVFIPYTVVRTLDHLDRKEFLLHDTQLRIACIEAGGRWEGEKQECVNSERRVRINQLD